MERIPKQKASQKDRKMTGLTLYDVYDRDNKCFFDVQVSDPIETAQQRSHMDLTYDATGISTLRNATATIRRHPWVHFWNHKLKANDSLIEAAKKGDRKKVIKLLNKLKSVEKTADLNYGDKKLGNTALHWAAACNHPEIVDLLLKMEADINVRNANKQTPLILACKEENMIVIQYLLGLHANVDIADQKGRTALHYAAWTGNSRVVKMLIRAGPRVIQRDRDGHYPRDRT